MANPEIEKRIAGWIRQMSGQDTAPPQEEGQADNGSKWIPSEEGAASRRPGDPML